MNPFRLIRKIKTRCYYYYMQYYAGDIPLFDASYYLENNADVAASGMNPSIHYLLYGKNEGRQIKQLSEDELKILNSKSYTRWIQEFDTFSEAELNKFRNSIPDFQIKPLISVIMPVYDPNPEWVAEAIESVINQVYPHWELCIADDGSKDEEIRKILSSYQQKDSRIKVTFRASNGHISAASNSALEMACGDYIALLDHDDILPLHALFRVVKTINQFPHLKLIYSDEDKIDENSVRSQPYFKCDWNPELFYSQNMISHLGVYAADLVKKIGGFRIGYEGSQDYDLALRFIERINREDIFHIPRVLYHWRIHDNSTSSIQDSKAYAFTSGQKAIEEHFQRTGTKASVEPMNPGFYRIKYELPDPLPMVTLIILTRNKSDLLNNCINSILTKTSYPNYEILIVDNDSDEEETLHYLERIQYEAKVRCIRDERPFNFSALCNNGVNTAEGEYIGLINNDIEVITPEWLNEMVAIAAQNGVGAVGAKLLYPDNTIQHSGIIMGIGGVASHAHKHQHSSSYGYFGRAVLLQEMTAVTAACCLIRKSTYEVIGGFDEVNLPVAFNDVDFCIRLKRAGFRNIYTPFATLYHHESVSRGKDDTEEKNARFQNEQAFMNDKWGTFLHNDPAYNPNLTLKNENFELAWPPRNS